MKFKVGDIVKCVNDSNWDGVYKEGREYKITGIRDTLYETDHEGAFSVCFEDDFKLVEEKPHDSTKQEAVRECVETLMNAFEMHQDPNIKFAIESVMRGYFDAVEG